MQEQTRAIKVDGTALTATLTDTGVQIAGLSLTWAGVLCAAAAGEPTPSAVAAALRRLTPSAPTRPPASAGSLADVLTRLDAWFLQHRQRFHAGLRPGASAAQCAALGDCLSHGHPLLTELSVLLSWHNGQDPDVPGGFEETWRLMSADQIATAKVDLDAAGDPVWKPTWIPFLENDRGDCLCLDAAGPVRAYCGGQGEPKVEAKSLTEWFTRFLSDVEAGKYHEDPERGGFLRAE